MPGRSFSSPSYRYGFNGKEKDDEVKGSGNSLDFGARIHDPRLGRFLSLDPLSKKFPSESNYGYAGNNPILFIDREGERKTLYVTLIDETGGVTTFKRVDNRDIRIDLARTGSETWDHVQVKDIEQNVVIDMSKGTYSVSAEKVVGTYAMGTGEYLEKGLVGLGDVQEGGWYLTSSNGGVDPTRNTSKSHAEEKRNMMEDLVLPAPEGRGLTEAIEKLGIGKAKLGKIDENVKIVADIFAKSTEFAVITIEAVQKAVEVVKGVSEVGPDAGSSGKYVTCRNSACRGDTIPIEKASGHIPKDTLTKDAKGNYQKAEQE